MAQKQQNPLEEIKKLMPSWVYWVIAVFGIVALVAVGAYAYYLKRKGAQA